jgi:hypothetical protein
VPGCGTSSATCQPPIFMACRNGCVLRPLKQQKTNVVPPPRSSFTSQPSFPRHPHLPSRWRPRRCVVRHPPVTTLTRLDQELAMTRSHRPPPMSLAAPVARSVDRYPPRANPASHHRRKVVTAPAPVPDPPLVKPSTTVGSVPTTSRLAPEDQSVRGPVDGRSWL